MPMLLLREIAILRQVKFILRHINIRPAYFLVPVLLSSVAALLEGVSIGLLIPLLQGFMSKDFSFIQSIPILGHVIQYIGDGEALRDRTLFGLLLGIFAACILLKNFFRLGATLSMSFLATRSVHHLRKQLFARYLTYGKMFFDRSSLGYHGTVLSYFTGQAMAPILMIDKFASAILSLVAYLILMLFISWKLTLIAIPLFVVLHLAVARIIKRIHLLSRSISESVGQLGKKGIDILSMLPLVHIANTERQEERNYAGISDETARLEFRRITAQQIVRPIQEVITLFCILFLFAGMLYLIVQEQMVTATSFLVYFYIIMNAATKFSAFSGSQTDMVAGSGPLQAIVDLFSSEDKYYVPQGSNIFDGLHDRIEFHHLSFAYQNDRPILDNVTFSVSKGSLVAIVGPTGAGKTTITSLLLRFYDCPPGTIMLDGKDIRTFTLASIRNHIAFVSQETLMLHDTLGHNITYGQQHVSKERLKEILRQSRLEDLVESLPQGLDTVIGDRGVKLSGGEKQRVAIARALLKNADILVLDEATSSLDSKTERLVQEAIVDALQNRTAIVIAHRLSTIKNADNIVVIDDGKVAEQGTPEQLLVQKGLFASLWEQQKFI